MTVWTQGLNTIIKILHLNKKIGLRKWGRTQSYREIQNLQSNIEIMKKRCLMHCSFITFWSSCSHCAAHCKPCSIHSAMVPPPSNQYKIDQIPHKFSAQQHAERLLGTQSSACATHSVSSLHFYFHTYVCFGFPFHFAWLLLSGGAMHHSITMIGLLTTHRIELLGEVKIDGCESITASSFTYCIFFLIYAS